MGFMYYITMSFYLGWKAKNQNGNMMEVKSYMLFYRVVVDLQFACPQSFCLVSGHFIPIFAFVLL